MRTICIFFLLGLFTRNGFSQNDTLIIHQNDSTKLTLIKNKFDPETHEIIYWDSTQQTITSIDNKPVFGTDAQMPLTELTLAELTVNNQIIRLETSGMFDPWAGTSSTVLNQSEKFLGNPLKIRCMFSNGAGSYLVEWTIIGSQSIRTMITNDRKILDVVKFEE